MSLKMTLKDNSDLILAIGGVVGLIGGFLIWIATMVLTTMIDERIAARVGTTESVTDLETAVVLNTDAINDLGADVNDLDESINGLNDDVKATLRILAEQ